MSEVNEVEKLFKAVKPFPNDVELASLSQHCMVIVSDLQRQLDEARESLAIKDRAHEIACHNLAEEIEEKKALERQLEEYMEIIKAVAHIGIDWGYGKFELKQDHIDKARKLYEAHEQLKEQG